MCLRVKGTLLLMLGQQALTGPVPGKVGHMVNLSTGRVSHPQALQSWKTTGLDALKTLEIFMQGQ